jgi:hypothetical protein
MGLKISSIMTPVQVGSRDRRLRPSARVEAFLGEVINLHYRFSASYFGRVEEVLRAVGRILDDPTVVVDVQLDELKHGECLIQTILLQIQEIRKKLSKQ